MKSRPPLEVRSPPHYELYQLKPGRDSWFQGMQVTVASDWLPDRNGMAIERSPPTKGSIGSIGQSLLNPVHLPTFIK